MRVLITNNTLAERAGSELYVRDLAIALLRRGHQPVAYSNRLGAVAEELRSATVPVVDDLSQLTVPPDIIHGQHHLDTMVALLRFPGVPAVYFCHGWLPWEEMAPHFPAIQLYVAVDDLCIERLQCMNGIAPQQIRVIRNSADLQRFTLRSQLPLQPRRALAFSNYMPETGCLEILRRACASRGIELEAVGGLAGRVESRPEEILGQYDIVFGKARCALEAMVSGTAVIVCDANGLGEMVTPANYEALRRLNFGARCLHQSITLERIGAQLDCYDPVQARRVSLRARTEASLDEAVDQTLAVYQEAISAYRETSPSPTVLFQSASDYLRDIADLIKARHQVDHQRMLAEADATAQRLHAERAEDALRATQSVVETEALRATQLDQQRLLAEADAAEQRLRADQAEHALRAAQSEVERQTLRATRTEAAKSQLEEQRVEMECTLVQRESELAAIQGSRLWPVMTRIQRFRRLVLNRMPGS